MEALDAALFPSIIRLTIKKQKRAELGVEPSLTSRNKRPKARILLTLVIGYSHIGTSMRCHSILNA
jgi:hypothetical protein